jgi:hypothetical protein
MWQDVVGSCVNAQFGFVQWMGAGTSHFVFKLHVEIFCVTSDVDYAQVLFGFCMNERSEQRCAPLSKVVLQSMAGCLIEPPANSLIVAALDKTH